VYTSVFYCPIFATPEAAPPFIPLAALALVLLVNHVSRLTLHVSRFTPLVLFTLLHLAASLFSYSQHDSLTWSFKLLTLLTFTFAIPLTIHTPAHWRRIALLVVVVSVAIPTLLSVVKLVELAWRLGIRPAMQYRMGLTELGRANLIARTLMIGAPLLIAQAITATLRTRRAPTSPSAGSPPRVLAVAGQAPLTSRGGPPSPLKSGGTEGGLVLAFDVATAPESWSQPGDGVTFAIYVESGQDMQPETRNLRGPQAERDRPPLASPHA